MPKNLLAVKCMYGGVYWHVRCAPCTPPVLSAHVLCWPEPYIYTVYVRYFWQRNHLIYGHIRCIYTVLANPTHVLCAHVCEVATQLWRA